MVIRETAAQERPVIGLLLEGTYPFVQGGVSSWTHQLIEGLSSEYDFKLIFIGSRAKDYGPAHYDLQAMSSLLSVFICLMTALIQPLLRTQEWLLRAFLRMMRLTLRIRGRRI